MSPGMTKKSILPCHSKSNVWNLLFSRSLEWTLFESERWGSLQSRMTRDDRKKGVILANAGIHVSFTFWQQKVKTKTADLGLQNRLSTNYSFHIEKSNSELIFLMCNDFSNITLVKCSSIFPHSRTKDTFRKTAKSRGTDILRSNSTTVASNEKRVQFFLILWFVSHQGEMNRERGFPLSRGW